MRAWSQAKEKERTVSETEGQRREVQRIGLPYYHLPMSIRLANTELLSTDATALYHAPCPPAAELQPCCYLQGSSPSGRRAEEAGTVTDRYDGKERMARVVLGARFPSPRKPVDA